MVFFYGENKMLFQNNDPVELEGSPVVLLPLQF